jgi:hypothetical protein
MKFGKSIVENMRSLYVGWELIGSGYHAAIPRPSIIEAQNRNYLQTMSLTPNMHRVVFDKAMKSIVWQALETL